MSERRADTQQEAAAARVPAVTPPSPRSDAVVPAPRGALSGRLASKPRTREDAEAHYIAAREAWTQAMRAAASGRPADLASLALAQETFESAAAERERWAKEGPRVAIPIEPDTRRGLDAAVGQELRWRDVRAPHEQRGLLGRLKKRIGR